MAVDVAVYGTVALVTGYVREIIVGGEFGDTSRPTLTDVEAFIDGVGMQINNTLLTAGYTVPVVAATDPYPHRYLVTVNSAGAAAHVLSAIPGDSWEPPTIRLARSRRQYLENQLFTLLELIQKGGLAASRSDSILDRLVVGSYKNADGEVNTPLFTRSVTDNPGSRSLVEP